MRRSLVRASSLIALGLTAHTAYNLTRLRSLPTSAPDVAEAVSILIPARNEAGHVEQTVRDALSQTGIENLQVIVLDDGSTDATGAILDAIDDPRLTVIHAPDDSPPDGWLGKPWACARLAEHASGTVLVFLDADVHLEPGAVAGGIHLLRTLGLDLVAPYPRIDAPTPLQRLVQPLLTWSWATTVPLGWAEESQWSSLSAANGQILIFDASAYHRIGGHAAVSAEVLEDIALMRAIRSAGGRAITADGTDVASCQMYDSDPGMVDGYTKSLWDAFGSAPGSVVGTSLLVGTYVLPAAAMFSGDARTRRWGALGYAAGVAGRELVARRTGEPCLSRGAPDPLTHPLSIGAFAFLTALSWKRRRAGTTQWKGRPV
ncbi:MAG: glycosyltransferase [Actinobacteria bacterium]|nr:glycosyltransferase [Actinomycetota bacterium]